MKRALFFCIAAFLLASPTALFAADDDAAPAGADSAATVEGAADGSAATGDAAPEAEKAEGDAAKAEGDDAKAEGDEEKEERKSAHGDYEWKFSWGGGVEVGAFFTSLSRWSLHLLEPNNQPEYDVTMMMPVELAFEVAPLEGLRLSVFGGMGMTLGADPGMSFFFAGLEPAFTVRRSIWEFALGSGFGYGGASATIDSDNVGDADILLVRPFVETRVYPTDYMAVYARVGFNLMRVLDFTSDTLQVRDEQERTTSADHLSEAGPYVGLGVRFGSYPDHVKVVPDTDEDGYRDDVDDCPNDPEDMDGFQDEDGCPELDNDADGVADSADGCPLVAEDKDGWKDEDGCPEDDDDTDGDGILNAVDKCVTEAEDKDGFQDEDGCPDLDNDGDSIPDTEDDCPDEAGVPAKKGCPFKMVEVTAKKIVINEKVFFELNKAEIMAESNNLLNEVAQVLNANPRIKKIEVQGHTDTQGKKKHNMKLSNARAKAVMDYLIEKGVDAERLTSKGYGPTMLLVETPKGEKETEEAAAQNRRVEFIILEQDEVKKVLREDQVPEDAAKVEPTE